MQTFSCFLEQKLYVDFHDLIVKGAVHCASMWGTELLAPKSLIASLADVVLPIQDKDQITQICDLLTSKYNTFVIARSVNFYPTGDEVWVIRLSAQIYLEMNDFVLLADRVLELIQIVHEKSATA